MKRALFDGAKEMLLVEDIEDRDFLNKRFEVMYKELPEPKERKQSNSNQANIWINLLLFVKSFLKKYK